MTETPVERRRTAMAAEAPPETRHRYEGDLWEMAARTVWDAICPLRLGGEEFGPVYLGEDSPPGYKDDDTAVLIRRVSDGMVFEVDIDVTMRPVRGQP